MSGQAHRLPIRVQISHRGFAMEQDVGTTPGATRTISLPIHPVPSSDSASTCPALNAASCTAT